MNIIKTKNLIFEYIRRDENGNVESINKAIDDINIEVNEGEFIAVLGSNGSGKSTFAKHLNALLTATEGTVWITGLDASESENVNKIRKDAGMVFQNPDNQIVGAVVEEDVGFGPENLGVPTSDIWKRVEESLSNVGMLKFRKSSPNKLSGGQKQKVAIASIMAMKPKCIILDEATAMLDPLSRKEVLNAIIQLNKKENITIIFITHYMEEVVNADKIFVINKGKLVLQGTPKEVFSKVDELKSYDLTVPQVTQLAYELKKEGLMFEDGILTVEEFVENIKVTSLF